MTYLKAILIFFGAFICQGSIINLFSINGATPNLLLCLVILFSFLYEEDDYGILLGVVFGLLYDICYMPYVGVTAIWFYFLALGVALARDLLNRENITTILIMTIVGTIAVNSLIWVTYAIMGSGVSYLYMLKHQPFVIMWNVIIEGILYMLVIQKVLKRRRDLFYQ